MQSIPERPADLYDREQEWSDLVAFSVSPPTVPRLGLVYGRRRQGKSHLLRTLTASGRAIYHQALEEERAPALARIATLVASTRGLDAMEAGFPDWSAALRSLIDLAGPERAIVLDEFPYLLARSPELPSAIQAAFDDAAFGRRPPFRLLLCGSAMSVMSELLSGQRALLDLVVSAFDFRTAAGYWGIGDPETAFLVHAVVGGIPGYRALLDGQAPVRAAGLFEWLSAGVLNPSHAMFREADYLLTEDPVISDRALYQSVLGAIAQGRATRSAIGSYLHRNDAALRHPLLVLERAGFIRRDQDLLRERRPLLRLDDPCLRFHHVIVRPDISRFEARDTQAAWQQAAPVFGTRILGPHLEQLARDWTQRFASDRTLGGSAAQVGWAQLSDASARSRLELDVVALGREGPAGRRTILAIGEAKARSSPMTGFDLVRLERARVMLAERADASGAKLLLFSRTGFERGLRSKARSRDDVELVDLERLYGGD